MFEGVNIDKQPSRKTIRLIDYDYSNEGLYFVTICTKGFKCLFGQINNSKVNLNKIGETVDEYWQEIHNHYPQVILHDYIIMPNHIHGIIEITTLNQVKKQTLGFIIRGFKIGVTKWVRNNSSITLVWQRNFYEHIIRNEKSYENISQYISENPKNWLTDKFYK